MFRIKCLNKLLLTKDICYQRDPVLYKSKTCIACYEKEESLEHLAECQIYQRIWKKLEAIIIEELAHLLSSKWKITVRSQILNEIFLGLNTETRLQKRKLHIRRLTDTSLVAESKALLGSTSKANKAIFWFTEIFWSNFFERLWKFRCEVMAEWEKRNEIDSKKKKKKSKHNSKAKVKKKQENKENQAPARKVIKESEQDKEIRIQKEAESKVEK